MKLLPILLLCIMLLFSCDKGSVELEYTDVLKKDIHTSTVVLRGSVTSEYAYHSLMLYTTASYLDFTYHDIENATVYVEVDGEIYEYIESIYHTDYPDENKFKGLYVSRVKYKGKPGYNHTAYAKINNTTYSATDFMLPASDFNFTKDIVPYIEVSRGERNTENGFVQYTDSLMQTGQIYFAQNESYILEWESKKYDKFNDFISDTDSREFVHTYYFERIESQQIMNIGFEHKTGELYLKPDDITVVKKLSTSKPFMQYSYEVFKETLWNASDFSTIPANISTNVTQGGLGFFSAHDVYSKSIKFSDLFKLAIEYDNIIDYGQFGDI